MTFKKHFHELKHESLRKNSKQNLQSKQGGNEQKKKRRKLVSCLSFCLAPLSALVGLPARLKYKGDGEPPTREYVGEVLLFDACWLNTEDLYSFIALPNKKDFELCFFNEAPL